MKRAFSIPKIAQAAVLAIAVCFTLGATDASSRYNDLNHRTMCTCGCAEILGECNHVGCSMSTEELAMIRDGISDGKSDKAILDGMVARYGAVVLAAPTKEGFNLLAWIAPFLVLGAGILGTVLLVRRWTIGHPQTAGGFQEQVIEDPEERERRERIRRETGADGGF
jgi:cytochrome c-type biogenesis protein CcmH/NrfF